VKRTASGASVTFTLTNTGTRTGAEVPQVYVGDPAAVGEPPKQLEGFRRVSLLPGSAPRLRSRSARGRSRTGTRPATNGW
jgi:beta-glucosidase